MNRITKNKEPRQKKRNNNNRSEQRVVELAPEMETERGRASQSHVTIDEEEDHKQDANERVIIEDTT